MSFLKQGFFDKLKRRTGVLRFLQAASGRAACFFALFYDLTHENAKGRKAISGKTCAAGRKKE